MLSVVKPITITDAMLLAHSEPEADAAAWSSGTTYADADQVLYLHKVYESLQASNLNKTPGATASADWWAEVSPSNRWAMFDGLVDTATLGAGTTLSVSLQPGEFITAVALAAVQGAEVRVLSTSGGDVVYDQTQSVNAGSAPNPYDWCFGDRDEQGDLLFTDLPPYLDAQIDITISGGTTSACGVLALGRAYEVGQVELGAEAGITDYSRKSTDDFGNATFVRRRNAKRMQLPVVINRQQFRPLHALLASLTATPCMWVGDEDTDVYGPFFVWGWFRDFRLVVQFRDVLRMNLEIEGLT